MKTAKAESCIGILQELTVLSSQQDGRGGRGTGREKAYREETRR